MMDTELIEFLEILGTISYLGTGFIFMSWNRIKWTDEKEIYNFPMGVLLWPIIAYVEIADWLKGRK